MSDELYAAEVAPDGAWLETGLSDARLRGIGLITLVWNAAEFNLQQLIWVSANWDWLDGMLVTADQSNVWRCQLAKNIITSKIENKRLVADALRAVAFFDICRIRRNALIHGIPSKLENGVPILGYIEAKQGRGRPIFKKLDPTEDHIDTLAKDIGVCRIALVDAREKGLRFFEFNQASPPYKQSLEEFVFGYAKIPFDTKRLQTRLDQLRPLPPNQNISHDPPPTSRA